MACEPGGVGVGGGDAARREKMERVRDSKGGVVTGRGWLRDSVQKMELEPTVALLYLYEKIRIYCRWIQHMREAQAVTYMYFGCVCVCVRACTCTTRVLVLI